MIVKHPVNLSLRDFKADDTNWVGAKITLNKTLKGRQIVEFAENHLNTKSTL